MTKAEVEKMVKRFEEDTLQRKKTREYRVMAKETQLEEEAKSYFNPNLISSKLSDISKISSTKSQQVDPLMLSEKKDRVLLHFATSPKANTISTSKLPKSVETKQNLQGGLKKSPTTNSKAKPLGKSSESKKGRNQWLSERAETSQIPNKQAKEPLIKRPALHEPKKRHENVNKPEIKYKTAPKEPLPSSFIPSFKAEKIISALYEGQYKNP